MPDVMLALGDYRFSVDTAAYDSLRRRSEYRWAQLDRIAHRPSLQYVGMGMEEIDLRGVIYPHYRGGLTQLDLMRDEAGQGQPLDLVSGRGENLGKYCITEIEEEQSVFAMKGAPRAVEFRLRLRQYGPDKDEGTGAQATVSTTAPAAKTLTVTS
jgi:phage protein U